MIVKDRLCLSTRKATLDEMASLTRAWIQLPGDGFMQHPDWLLTAWTQYHRLQSGVDEQSFLGLLTTDSDEQLIGCSAWFRQVKHAIQWWRLVGSDSICSDYVHMPCSPELESQVGAEMAAWFDANPRRLFGLPVAIEVEGHCHDSVQWAAFFDALVERGWSLDSIETEGAWRLELPMDWQTYESQLHKSQRRKARQAIRFCEGMGVQHLVCRSPSEIEEHWPAFVHLHQQRRQFLGQHGCFADPRFEDFLKLATLKLASQNKAWLSMVLADEAPLAILLMFDHGDTSFLYQSGLDTTRIRLQPGHLVNTATIAHCIQRGQRHLDFLRGDERYKSAWLARRTPLYRSVLFPPGFAGRRLNSALRLRRNLLSWLDSSRHPASEPGDVEKDEN